MTLVREDHAYCSPNCFHGSHEPTNLCLRALDELQLNQFLRRLEFRAIDGVPEHHFQACGNPPCAHIGIPGNDAPSDGGGLSGPCNILCLRSVHVIGRQCSVWHKTVLDNEPTILIYEEDAR